jgi:hypothetical protein
MRKTNIFKYSLAALVTLAAGEPTLALAGACAGPQKAWTVKSDTFGNLQCGTLAGRGFSLGGTNSVPGSPVIPFSLSVTLTSGTHASGIAYNSVGTLLPNCNPFDASTADGKKTVQGVNCISGSKHQVIVVFP